MAISVTTTNEQIAAAVTNEQVTATVSPGSAVSATVTAGFGAIGPAGPPTTDASLLTSGTIDAARLPATVVFASSLATVATTGAYADLTGTPAAYVLPQASGATLGGILVGNGLTFFGNGRVDVVYGTGTNTACQGNDSRLSNARTPSSHVHGNITNAGAIGSTSGQIVVTTTSGVLTTAASIALSQLSQSSATTGQVVAWNGSAWAPAAAGGYTLPNATTSTLGGVIVGTGLSVSSGTVSAAVTSVAGRTGAVTIAAADVSGLGSLATQSGTFSGTSSGTNTGDQTITLSGDVTGSGTGSFAATLSTTGVAASSYGSASSVATFTVDAKGRLTTAGSASIAIAASAVTSGTFDSARIPTIAYSSLSGVPSTFAPSAHTHTLSELSQSGATTNQVPQWNGSAWVPATVSGGGGGGSSSASDLTSGTLNDALLSFVPIHPFLLMGG